MPEAESYENPYNEVKSADIKPTVSKYKAEYYSLLQCEVLTGWRVLIEVKYFPHNVLVGLFLL